MPSQGKKEGATHHRYWHDFAEKNLFGIEINEQIARTAKMNMIIHDDGHTNVVAADGLLSPADLVAKTGNAQFEACSFDFIITNPPFGSSVRQTEQAYFKNYRLATKSADWLNPKSRQATRPAQDTEVLFIEQCHTYLREGGYLAVVIPDGILTNSSLQYVRDQLESLYRIIAVVSMPQTAFAATGAGVKSSVLFLRKHSAIQSKAIDDLRQRLQDDTKTEQKFDKKLAKLEQDKRDMLKKKTGFVGTELGRKAALELATLFNTEPDKKWTLEDTHVYGIWKKELSEAFTQKIDALKYFTDEIYQELLRKNQFDYEIFMAIAEDIGYDSTGNKIDKNDLISIEKRLSNFLHSGVKTLANIDHSFVKNLSELAVQQRWDPLFHQFNVFKFATNVNVNFQRMGSLIKYVRTGFAAGKADQDNKNGVIQIRPTNINEDRNLVFERNVCLPFDLLKEFPQDRLQKGEVLFNNTNSQDLVGKTTFFNLEGDYFCSNHITRIQVDPQQINPLYLAHILNGYQRMKIFYRMCVNWNNQSGINAEALKKLLIPVPALTVQNKLVADLTNLEEAAQELRQQAQHKLDDARTQVRKFILNN